VFCLNIVWKYMLILCNKQLLDLTELLQSVDVLLRHKWCSVCFMCYKLLCEQNCSEGLFCRDAIWLTHKAKSIRQICKYHYYCYFNVVCHGYLRRHRLCLPYFLVSSQLSYVYIDINKMYFVNCWNNWL